MRKVRLRSVADVRLGRQRSPQNAEGPHMIRYLRAANVKSGRLELDDVKEMNFTPVEQVLFRLEPGDVLVTEGAGSLDAVGASAPWHGEIAGTVCVQNTLVRLRPRPNVDPEFLAWWAEHAYTSRAFASFATGANIFHLGAEGVRGMPFPELVLVEQKRIASFLNAETARIDELSAAKERQIDLVSSRLLAEREFVVWSSRSSVRLRAVIDPQRPVMYGIVLPGPNYEGPDSVAIVKGGDVGATFARPLKRTSSAIEAPYARARLQGGDTVLAIRGGIGDAALVPAWASGANITQDVARLAPARAVDPSWLYHVVCSLTFQRQAQRFTTGATIRGINIGDIKHFGVPQTDYEAQARQGRELDESEESVRALVSILRSEIALLTERRRALITAAVTGELKVQ